VKVLLSQGSFFPELHLLEAVDFSFLSFPAACGSPQEVLLFFSNEDREELVLLIFSGDEGFSFSLPVTWASHTFLLFF